MKKTYNKDNGKTTWEFNEWYKKLFYVVGLCLTWFYGVAFLIGLLAGLLGAF